MNELNCPYLVLSWMSMAMNYLFFNPCHAEYFYVLTLLLNLIQLTCSIPIVSMSQGCGNTMPDLSDLVPFHSGQVENFYLLVLGQVQKYKVNKILYFIFWLIIMSSYVALKTMCILISWLLLKPADLDLHCLQEKWYLHGFILFSKVSIV